MARKAHDMVIEQPTLSGQQEQAIALMLSGQTQRETAAVVGVDEATLSRWVNNSPEFAAEFGRRKKELWEHNAERLRQLASAAIDTLEQALQSDNETVRLRAAATILKATGLQAAGKPKDPTSITAAVLAQMTAF